MQDGATTQCRGRMGKEFVLTIEGTPWSPE